MHWSAGISYMIPAKDFLNKIKWDKRENPKNYSLLYLDRIKNKLIEIPYESIEIDGEFILTIDGKNIPMHRIKQIRKKNKLVWERKN